jgi:type IV secretory pathway VirB4 component
MDLFWDRVKKDRNVNKSIYLDEAWRLIGANSNKEVAGFIYKIFKTIRKFGGSAVAITQDVSDLFALDDGVYGKSILSNSSIKTIFSLEEENISVLDKFIKLTDEEKINIKSMQKGESIVFAGNDHIMVKVVATESEKEII